MNKVRILLLALAAFTLPNAYPGQTSLLDALVGRDLWRDRLSQDDESRMGELLNPAHPGPNREPIAWHVWRTTEPSNARYVVLQVAPLITIPGGSSACLHTFDGDATRISRWCFPVGWRIGPTRAYLEFSQDLRSDLIVLQMERAINGRNIAREYYSLSNNQLRLVRLEDDKGNVIHNAYTLPTYTIGVVPAAKTIREFTQMLDSADKAEVLEALGFLGARHFDDFPGSTEHSEHAQFVQVLTESQQIRAIILHLAKSPHPWIREAGALATRPLKARPIF